jgi:hypothetical protein
MKKLRLLLFLSFFIFLNTRSSYAMLISFLAEDNFAGVDNIWGFSTTDQLNNLGKSSLSLLNGGATLTARTGGGVGQEAILTQRGIQGLGILGGGYADQIDWAPSDNLEELEDIRYLESLGISFKSPVYLEWVELRAFYFGQFLYTGLPSDRGGWIDSLDTSGEGVYRYDYRSVMENELGFCNPLNSIAFGFDQGGHELCHFSLARLEVSPAPVPEPPTVLLLGTGLAGLLRLRKRK